MKPHLQAKSSCEPLGKCRRSYNLYLEGGFVDYLSHPSFEGYKREVDGQFVREDDFVNLIPEKWWRKWCLNSLSCFLHLKTCRLIMLLMNAFG